MKSSAPINIFNRVSFQERLLFTKHLHTMIKSDISLPEAFDTLIDQNISSVLKKVLTAVKGDVENGKSLSAAFAKHPKSFDQIYISLIKVGEESGTLEDSLGFLVKQMGKDYALHKKVRSALMYPAIVVSAIGIMGTFISIFILPRLVEFFEAFDIELPLATKVLLFIATVAKNYGFWIIGLTVFGVVVLSFVANLKNVKPFRDRIFLKLPIVGNLISHGQLARFSRNLGTLIKTGIPINRSMVITADSLTNMKFKMDLMEVAKSLEKGKSIGETLEKRSYFEYPPLVSKMIKIGEKTGRLDENLIYLSEFYEDEIDEMSKNLSTIIEPVLLIVIGLVVGFVALAIISPIYELTGSIRR